MSFKTLAVLIDGIKTNIAVSEYIDSFFIVLTQFDKLGAIVTVRKDSIEGIGEERSAYNVETALGPEDGPGEIVARFLAEQLGLSKPAVFSVALRDSSPRSLHAIAHVLRTLRKW